jgi:ferredoxin
MDLDVRREIGGAECIACGDCKKACPGEGIKRSFGFGLGTRQTAAVTDL